MGKRTGDNSVDIWSITSATESKTLKRHVQPIIDPYTQTWIMVEEAHSKTHIGDHYYMKGFTDLTEAAPTLELYMVIPAGVEPNALGEFAAEGEMEIFIYENPTQTDVGSPFPVYNRNRNSTNTNSAIVTVGPTLTDDGTLIWSTKVGSGRQSGGTSREGVEIILKEDTEYLVRVSKIAAGTLWFDYLFDWYETAPINSLV